MSATNEVKNFLIGLGIGVTVALLLAPRRGSELRRDLSDRTQGFAESARQRFNRLRKKVEAEAEELDARSRAISESDRTERPV